VLTLALRRRLPRGDYTVRWSIVSEDGHREQGLLAFGVGRGSPTPHPVLGSVSTFEWRLVVFRAVYYLGILAGAGAAVFGVTVRPLLGPHLLRPLSQLLFFALLAAFVGASAAAYVGASGTRFALVLRVAAAVALVGGVAAALAPVLAPLLALAAACALALVAAPAVAGHALDRDQPRVTAALVDVAHTGTAAVWLGGLVSLLYVLPRATEDERLRRAGARRWSRAAAAAVVVLGTTGIGRALTELHSAGQLGTTWYGRVLLVKTAVFAPLLVLGWTNRARLEDAFVRLRQPVATEAIAIGALVLVVAVLTELRPGVAARTRASRPPAAHRPLAPTRYDDATRPAVSPPSR
jgi:copper transport protein